MKRNTAFVLTFSVVLILVIVFCAVWFFSGDSDIKDKADPVENSENVPASPSPDNSESQDANSDNPGDSSSEDMPNTQTPDASQSAESIIPVKTSTGNFSSNTGTALNLVVNWKAATRPTGEIDITFDIGVSSYAFYTDSLPNGILLTVEDAAYTLTSAAVAYDGQTLKTTTLATYTATLPPDTQTADVSVKWNYSGAYSGVDIGNIEISETISF